MKTTKQIAEEICAVPDFQWRNVYPEEVDALARAVLKLEEEKAVLVEALEQIIQDCNPHGPRSHIVIANEAAAALAKVSLKEGE